MIMTAALVLISLGVFVVIYISPYVGLLNMAYPAAALIIGGWLYISRPVLYVGFTWWIWFITPFVRRVIDFQVGFHNPGSITKLAPIFVTGFTLFTVLRFGGWLRERQYFPFLMAIAGIIYGYLVGLAKVGAFSATYGMVGYLMPVMMSFHIVILWQEYPVFRRVLLTTFTWGALVIGLYGVIQFVFAPPWDMQWLVESGMTSSMGKPEPYKFRVFSTLSATGPFAKIMMTGGIVLFAGRTFLSRFAMIPCYAGLAYSFVRAAWGGWAVALSFLVFRLTGKLRLRLLALLIVGGIMIIPILMLSPAGDRVSNRFGTIENLEEDGSLKSRLGLYSVAAPKILTEPIGRGIGAIGGAAQLSTGQRVSFDSGLLEVPLTFGWFGTFLYIGGLFLLLINVLRVRESEADQFAVMGASIVVAYLALLLFSNQFSGLSGLVIWTFVAVVLSSQMYHEWESSQDDAIEPVEDPGRSLIHH